MTNTSKRPVCPLLRRRTPFPDDFNWATCRPVEINSTRRSITSSSFASASPYLCASGTSDLLSRSNFAIGCNNAFNRRCTADAPPVCQFLVITISRVIFRKWKRDNQFVNVASTEESPSIETPLFEDSHSQSLNKPIDNELPLNSTERSNKFCDQSREERQVMLSPLQQRSHRCRTSVEDKIFRPGC